jgi:RES domain-containing protein
MTATKYANKDDLLTGAGSKKNGGRWNPPRSVHTVYLSLELETALAEFLAHYRYYRLPPKKGLPQVTVAVEAKLRSVLDLTDGPVRQRLTVSLGRLRGEDWRKAQRRKRQALTQALGLAAWKAGLDALIVPSAPREKGKNLIVFPGNLRPPQSWIRIVNRSSLPNPS